MMKNRTRVPSCARTEAPWRNCDGRFPGGKTADQFCLPLSCTDASIGVLTNPANPCEDDHTHSSQKFVKMLRCTEKTHNAKSTRKRTCTLPARQSARDTTREVKCLHGTTTTPTATQTATLTNETLTKTSPKEDRTPIQKTAA